MKVLLTILNAKYIHSSLALRYLKSFTLDLNHEVKIREFNINQQLSYIIDEIWREKPDIVGFSCYIWNRRQTLDIIKSLKRIRPDLVVVLGGPEISFDSRDFLEKHPEVDIIVKGEGEKTFRELLKVLDKEGVQLEKVDPDQLKKIKGLTFRANEQIFCNQERACMESSEFIPVYNLLGTSDLKDRLVYLETSRGCPYNCSYCISSTFTGVRYFPLEKVKKELETLVKKGVKVVKFVDRTFNCNEKRALEIMNYILNLYEKTGAGTTFHFEIKADIMSEEMLQFLETVPEGLFQFEIGVQSTHLPTLKEINRNNNLDYLGEVVKRLKKMANIHLHLDLIAGLPCETFKIFEVSFNRVFSWRPHHLQLGFLKLLPGSKIRKEAKKHGYIFTPYPPYQVLGNDCLTHEDMFHLQIIEEMLELYYNSHRFQFTLEWLLKFFSSPFDFFNRFGKFWVDQNYHHNPHKIIKLYQILKEFILDVLTDFIELNQKDTINDLLKFDLLRDRRSPVLPEFLSAYEVKDYNERFWNFLKDEGMIDKYLPHYKGLNPRRIARKIQIESFKIDVKSFLNTGCNKKPASKGYYFYLFDYGKKDVLTGRARATLLNDF